MTVRRAVTRWCYVALLAVLCITAACSAARDDGDGAADAADAAPELVSVDAEDWDAHPASAGLVLWTPCGPQLTNAGLCLTDLDTGRVEVLLGPEARISTIGGLVDGELTVTAGPTFDDMAYTVDPTDPELVPLGPGLVAGASTGDQRRLVADILAGTVQVIDYAASPPRTLAVFEGDPGEGTSAPGEGFIDMGLHRDLLWLASISDGAPVLRALDLTTGEQVSRLDLPGDRPTRGLGVIELHDRLAVLVVGEEYMESWVLPPTAELLGRPGDQLAVGRSELRTHPGWQILGPAMDPTRVVAVRHLECAGEFRCAGTEVALLSLEGSEPLTLGTVPIQLFQGAVTGTQ